MSRTGRPTGGTTLLELVIATTVFTVFLLAVYGTLSTGTRAFDTGTTIADLEVRARRTVDRISVELASAGASTLVPSSAQLAAPLGSSSLTFQRLTGYEVDERKPQWGNPARVEFQPEPSDPSDGVDNDRDGAIDEGVVALVENAGLPTERTIILARDVREYLEGETPNGADDNGNGLIDERGLAFDLAGTNLRVHLTLERVDGEGHALLRTVTTSVTLRN